LLPNTTRVHNPFELPEVVLPAPSSSVANSKLIPSQEWLQLFETRFRNLRKNIQQPTIHVGTSCTATIPPSMDRILWWSFFQGEPKENWYPEKRSKRSQKRMAKQMNAESSLFEEGPPYKKSRLEQSAPIAAVVPSNGAREALKGASEDKEIELQPEEGDHVRTQQIVYTEEGELVEPASGDGDIEKCNSISESTGIKQREVTFAALQTLEAKQALQLIRSFTYWLSHQPPIDENERSPTERYFPVSNSHARWVFGLLSILETHLTSDEIHMLRELARSIITLINNRLKQSIQSSRSTETLLAELAPWWMNVAIVVTIWGQRDLWNDAEDMVRRFT